MYYELATLNIAFAGAASAPERAAAFMNEGKGRLFGLWRPEFGAQNMLISLRGFDNLEELAEERQRARKSCDPFDCGEHILGMSFETFLAAPGFEDMETGAFGPLYELRSYRVVPGHLAVLLDQWAKVRPARDAISKMLLVLYPLDGSDRLVHLWPYTSLEERACARSTAWRDCEGWPPPAGFTALDPRGMESMLLLPTDQSPLS